MHATRTTHAPHDPTEPTATRRSAPAPAPVRRSFQGPPPFALPTIQRQAAISTPGDPFEREADAVADQVMRMADPAMIGRSAIGASPRIIQRTCAACGDDEDMVERVSDGVAGLQRKASSDGGATGDLAGVVRHGTASGGQVLDGNTRSFMERRFSRDFSAVRIHTGSAAAESARSVGAIAYTVGRDIVFAAGAYAPHDDGGRRLLAHELTHTVQQGAVGPAPASTSSPTLARMAAPEISGGAGGLTQLAGCADKGYRNCSGGCIPADGGTGFCAWGGSIAVGCVCYRRDQPMLNAIQQFLFNLVIAALIAAAIVLTAAAIIAIVACLMGPCEAAALVAAVGAAGAAIVMGIIGSGGGGAAAGDETA